MVIIIPMVVDESKTHLILSFMNILRVNVQHKYQIIEYSPKFVFCGNLEKRNRKLRKNNKFG